uniref:Uncharacterized protein n=1 Tax=Anguilla anguilla TaxID=7936 RepID=A0A0E9VBG1_ANGAN
MNTKDDERHTRSSSSTALNLSLFLVFMAVRLEKGSATVCGLFRFGHEFSY